MNETTKDMIKDKLENIIKQASDALQLLLVDMGKDIGAGPVDPKSLTPEATERVKPGGAPFFVNADDIWKWVEENVPEDEDNTRESVWNASCDALNIRNTDKLSSVEVERLGELVVRTVVEL